MKRRLFNVLTVASLVLGLATVALWVRSYWRLDRLYHADDGHQWVSTFGAQSNFGELGFYAREEPFSVRFAQFGPRWQYLMTYASSITTFRTAADLRALSRTIRIFGFGYDPGLPRPDYFNGRCLWFPHWFLALLLAILPAIRLRGILRTRRRLRAGLCTQCGYDLRESPDRCPECGTERMSEAG